MTDKMLVQQMQPAKGDRQEAMRLRGRALVQRYPDAFALLAREERKERERKEASVRAAVPSFCAAD